MTGPKYSHILPHHYTQTHSHSQLRKESYAARWKKQALCNDKENLGGLNHESFKIIANKQVPQPKKKKKRERKRKWDEGYFRGGLLKKKISVTKGEVVLGIYCLNRCFTDHQHSYSSSKACLTAASPSRPEPQTGSTTYSLKKLIKRSDNPSLTTELDLGSNPLCLCASLGDETRWSLQVFNKLPRCLSSKWTVSFTLQIM